MDNNRVNKIKRATTLQQSKLCGIDNICALAYVATFRT